MPWEATEYELRYRGTWRQMAATIIIYEIKHHFSTPQVTQSVSAVNRS